MVITVTRGVTRNALWSLPLALLLLATSVSTAEAQQIIRFSELPSQPVHGVSFGGVKFFFTMGGASSQDAWFSPGGPGTGVFVDGPCLEGNAGGVLWLLFEKPTPYVIFGIARLTVDTLPEGVVVDLFGDHFRFLRRVSQTTSPLLIFSEGQFEFSSAPVRLARITFPAAAQAPRFALDNLSYNVSPAQSTGTADSVELMIRSALLDGFEPALVGPPLPADVLRQQDIPRPSATGGPAAWAVKR